jgi:hypothetical protein
LSESNLNRRVAVEVMGWIPSDDPRIVDGWKRPDGMYVFDPENFAGTWEGAGMVVERMRELGYDFSLMLVRHDNVEKWSAVFEQARYDKPRVVGEALETGAPEAICLAALAALGKGE